MCTALALCASNTCLFGRNLDLDAGFGQQVVVTPRKFSFEFRGGLVNADHEALIGMATVINGYPLYAEATNESGLSAAGLNFPGNAVYHPRKEGATNVAPFEFIPYVLTQCQNLAQVRELLGSLSVLDEPFAPQVPNSPLHWMIADKSGALVVESMADGLHWFENPLQVLTNNPPFDFHLENVKLYLNVSPSWPGNSFAPDVDLAPVGVGFGGRGLPGDSSPASRFVKAAFERSATLALSDQVSVSQFFRILESVAMVKGDTLNQAGQPEFTVYSSCCDTSDGTYYYTTYGNHQITAVRLPEDLEVDSLFEFPLVEGEQFNFVN
ncbi:hypothetical protein BSR29_05200 [Boudabousia liubingyangii]|uniref:choloylglycine hydrolase n=1 Tax=Boudabousia liubingyangii TaxID=1921764 RepID=A0A1Q5PLJ3_9ACTO|nr:choloylglycine hydrolase [Boudabousia liubingyangii]OKL47887.1 hypothetical protein BSR29_05200 [Boudabousia liubingyangii]